MGQVSLIYLQSQGSSVSRIVVTRINIPVLGEWYNSRSSGVRVTSDPWGNERGPDLEGKVLAFCPFLVISSWPRVSLADTVWIIVISSATDLFMFLLRTYRKIGNISITFHATFFTLLWWPGLCRRLVSHSALAPRKNNIAVLIRHFLVNTVPSQGSSLHGPFPNQRVQFPLSLKLLAYYVWLAIIRFPMYCVFLLSLWIIHLLDVEDLYHLVILPSFFPLYLNK